MQINQIPHIIPGACGQATDFRTPGAGDPAQDIEGVTYRFQTVVNDTGDLDCRLEILIIAVEVKINVVVGCLPVANRSPGW
jgi:hypothetical protein